MKTVNGIRVYEEGEAIKLPDDYPAIPANDENARFGYKLAENEGVKSWIYASEEDYRSVETRLGTPSDQIESDIQKRLTDSKAPCGFDANHHCVGTCGLYSGVCRGKEDPRDHNHILYCACMGAGN